MEIGQGWVKLCGLARQEDLELALALGVEMVGFVAVPSSPRYVGAGLRHAWAGLAQGRALPVEVFGAEVDEALAAGTAVQACGFHAGVEPSRRIAVVRTREEAERLDPQAAGVLVDASVPGMHGGTGVLADWGLAARLAAELAVPVGLAGGLTPENVADAVAEVGPAWVDASSGVESEPGAKSPERMRRFVEEARRAFAREPRRPPVR